MNIACKALPSSNPPVVLRKHVLLWNKHLMITTSAPLQKAASSMFIFSTTGRSALDCPAALSSVPFLHASLLVSSSVLLVQLRSSAFLTWSSEKMGFSVLAERAMAATK